MDLFVSSVAGKAVTRYGTIRAIKGVPSPGLLIGAERDPAQPTRIVWDTTKVVRIPEAEAALFVREYGRALRDGALVERTETDWQAQQAPGSEQQ